MANVLNVTHSAQESEGACLPACLQMVLRYWGIERSQADIAAEIEAISNVGAFGGNVAKLRLRNLRAEYLQGSFELLHQWLAQGLPLIAFVQAAQLPYWHRVEAQHAVVVVGMGEGFAYVLDPAQDAEVKQVPLDDFALAWEDWMDARCVLISRGDQR